MKNFISFLILSLAIFLTFCKSKDKDNSLEGSSKFNMSSVIEKSVSQYTNLVRVSKEANDIPRTLEKDGSIRWISFAKKKEVLDWTAGYFPGTLWYLYELTGDSIWMNEAIHFQKLNIDDLQRDYMDVGFIANNSFGHGYRITGNDTFKEQIIKAADVVYNRFDPRVGFLLAWDADKGWQGTRGWQYPVIVDNMANMEILFIASELTGNPKYKEAATTHANRTMQVHYRDNMSAYHVVDLDSVTGEIRSKQTAQGYAPESRWARGQAWGLYGFTATYKHTKDSVYLIQAQKIADYIWNNAKVKDGCIPYWDYDAPNIPNEPVDASAAAITASALIELGAYLGEEYFNRGKKIVETLASDEYLAQIGTNGNFLIKHCVGSIPHKSEIDVPVIYADYYFLEALLKLKNIK
jgi:rhamnogalacturonyl hydrolase YesR